MSEGGVRVHLVDGTYELFRHHFGQQARRAASPETPASSRAATRGVLATVLSMIDDGAGHIGVATDHVIESFRNDLWGGYKTGEGVPEELSDQFGLLEDALEAMGVTVWPMERLEADDALASAAAAMDDDPAVAQVVIWTPDKDLAQCVRDGRVVQVDRRRNKVIDQAGVRERYGVEPASIPDWLALTGDSADGYPGLPGWGAKSSATVLAHYGHIDHIPDDVTLWDPALRSALRGAHRLAATLSASRAAVNLFRTLATLVVDRSLVRSAGELEWRGPTHHFEALCDKLGTGGPALAERARKLADARLA